MAIVLNPQPGDEDSFTTWIFWSAEYEKHPDLLLSAEVDLDWYEEGADLEIVGPAVEKEGILIYPAE